MNKKLLFLLVLLLTATTGSWAQSAFTAKEITSASQLTSTDDEAYVAACMPSDFLAVDVDVAKAWTAPTGGSAILIYAIDGDKIKMATFLNGSNKATTGATWSIATFKTQMANSKFYYTAAADYTVSLKDGTQDAGKWTVKAGTDGSFQSLPLEGVKAGTKVKLKYDGDRSMLKGVTAVKKAAAKEPATVTTAPTGAAIVGVGKTTALVSGGAAEGGTMMYKVTTENTMPATTDGFSDAVPTAESITASGKVYVWYYVKGDDTHSDSEIAATAIEVTVADVVDLSALTENTELKDGDVLTGTLPGNYKITIADGATVMLDGAVINGANDESCQWAGLTLAGDGTIILSGENSVKGFYENYPGIFVPANKTLTIQGDGSLTATGGPYSPGIGGGYQIACGNIVIEGGTVTATGGRSSAGIGGGRSASCGNISITGGTVTATGGAYSPGIGGGYSASCGNITIANTVTKVTATKGNSTTNSIGASKGGSCGTVTIGGNVTGNISTSPYTYQPSN